MKKTNLETLKTQFDKVHLKHIRPNHQVGTTIAILVKGDVGYVGISKCHEGDQFSREIGRNISFGRALSLVQDEAKKADSTRFVLSVQGKSSEELMQSVEEVIKERSLTV